MSRSGHQLNLHLNKKRQKTIIDKLVLVASFVYPLSGIPQVLSVYSGSTEGISIASWASFAIFSFVFLIYGVVHKIRPLAITNLLWLAIDCSVVVGVLTQRML